MDGGAHEKGLIEKGRDVELFGKGRQVVVNCLFDAINDGKRGGVAGFVDAHEHAAMTIGENYVGLRSEPVAHVGHVAQVDG